MCNGRNAVVSRATGSMVRGDANGTGRSLEGPGVIWAREGESPPSKRFGQGRAVRKGRARTCPPGPQITNLILGGMGYSAIWQMRKLRLTQAGPEPQLDLAVQQYKPGPHLGFWTLRLYCTALREVLTGGKMKLPGCRNVTRTIQ